MMKNETLTNEYADQIRPLLDLARRAYGARTQSTPAHEASRRYTELLVEYNEKGGSLLDLATSLGVAYSGIRRRIFTDRTPSLGEAAPKRKVTPEELSTALERVRTAKAQGPRQYHAQLSAEYHQNGISLGAIAKGLGIANAAPLYYGVQRHMQRVGKAV
jgi:transposase-like protein